MPPSFSNRLWRGRGKKGEGESVSAGEEKKRHAHLSFLTYSRLVESRQRGEKRGGKKKGRGKGGGPPRQSCANCRHTPLYFYLLCLLSQRKGEGKKKKRGGEGGS